MTKFTTVIYNPQKETPARNAGVYLGKRMVLLNKGVNELNEADLASIKELPQFGSLIENEILVISGTFETKPSTKDTSKLDKDGDIKTLESLNVADAKVEISKQMSVPKLNKWLELEMAGKERVQVVQAIKKQLIVAGKT